SRRLRAHRSARARCGRSRLDRDRSRAPALDHSGHSPHARRRHADAEPGRFVRRKLRRLRVLGRGRHAAPHALRARRRSAAGVARMTGTASPWAEALYGVIGLGLVVYALTGGADLGAGLLSLFSHGPRKVEQERAVRRAIAPIWE